MKYWRPTSSAVICIKHFEGKYLKKGGHEKRFTQHLPKHLSHLKFLFQENLQKKEFFKKISMMNLKETTISLVWKVVLKQTVRMVSFRQI